jgi:cysteine desulfurase/selenocysteine lyase
LNIPEFIGIDTELPLANGKTHRRVHLDAAASPLGLKSSQDCIAELLPFYANTHSKAHLSARITTEAYTWAQGSILESLGFDKTLYDIAFAGSGSTAAFNRIARGLTKLRPERPVTFISSMEHHSNDLPHRLNSQKTVFIPVIEPPNANNGALDLDQLESLLEDHKERVNYIAINSLSNVTGIKTPVDEICRLVHKHNVYVLVDGAQSTSCLWPEISVNEDETPDFWVFSGHKVYTPSSPGVLIAKKTILSALPLFDIGGGSVKQVSTESFELLDSPYKEQAGTPNIVGVIALASTLKVLSDMGFKCITQHSQEIAEYAMKRLATVPEISVYGDLALPRAAAISFNIADIDHGLVAVILSDYYAIAVRNACFCAHPYVRSLLKRELWDLDLDGIPEDQLENYINRKRGMVRASFALYTTREDIDYLVKSLEYIIINIKDLNDNYKVNSDGDYIHKSFTPRWREFFNP